ncbi:MAG TPA: hypothetical protein VKE70_34360, partial [Candidatus Solibacter sp.]|nr:hypothetical protein [Candidatus Solibacter sp.]
MLRLLWKWKASVILVLVLSIGVYGASFTSDENDCLTNRSLVENGLTYYCLLVAHVFAGVHGTQPARPSPATSVPLAFERNVGQADRQFEFLAHSTAGSVYLSKGAVDLDLRDGAGAPSVLRARFRGGNINAEALLEDPLPGHVN